MLTVAICSHNPRPHYLARAVEALRCQTLELDAWELLLIDNASKPPIDSSSVSWHPAGRYVREPELGLTAARLRAIKEARGNIIVFVDDDNVLSCDYLRRAQDIADKYPLLGAWGSGDIAPEFEREPSASLASYFPYLALVKVNETVWSNGPEGPLPVGAGLCVRLFVAQRYRDELLTDSVRRGLDRKGSSLDGGGDLDLALTANRFALGRGLFPDLTLTHIIPANRVSIDYLLRMVEAASCSKVLVLHRHFKGMYPLGNGLLWIAAKGGHVLLRRGWLHFRFFLAQQRGYARGYAALAEQLSK